jgi:hypothetical protein
MDIPEIVSAYFFPYEITLLLSKRVAAHAAQKEEHTRAFGAG